MVSYTIMDARQLFRYKGEQGDLVIEMVLWQLPIKTAKRPHYLKVQAVLRPSRSMCRAL